MRRRFTGVTGFVAAAVACVLAAGAPRRERTGGLGDTLGAISDRDLAPFGLRVDWKAFAPMAEYTRITGVHVFDQEVLVADNDTRLTSFDLSTGERRWMVALADPRQPILEPCVTRLDVYVVAAGHLVALDRRHGNERWRIKFPGLPIGGPAVAGDFAYVASRDGWLRAYSIKTQKEVWFFNAESPFALKPVIVGPEESPLVFLLTENKKMYCMSNQERKVLWQDATTAPVVASPARLDKYVYLPCTDFNVYGIDTSEATPAKRALWTFRSGSRVVDPPVVVGPTVYFPSFQNGFYAVRRIEGTKRWWRETGVQLLAVGKDRCYLRDAENAILVCDLLTGELLGRYVPPKGYTWFPTNAHSDAIVLVSEDGLVVCLRERAAAPALAPAP